MTLERGTLLHKRYRIVEILGQGGMGSVYRAVDENLGVEVAVKENLFTTDEYARQFRLEAVILANLRHPNLPRVTDHFVIGEQGQYLVMDYIEGEDLRQRMERLGMLPEEEVILVGAAMCDALAYLHTRKPPILHRDVKPGNVKITPEGTIFLVDFGLAKVLHGSQATTTGARAMTPGYSPPEQYGTARTDPRTDIYSLGATLYAALTGVIPEDGLARAMDNAVLTPVRKRNPKVSRRLAAAIEKAMGVRPDERFQSGEEFKRALLAASTRTQRSEGDYSVVPALDAGDVLRPEEIKVKPKPGTDLSPFPSALDNTELPSQPSPSHRQRGGCWWGAGVVALLLVAGSLSVAMNPGLRASLAEKLGAFTPTPLPTRTPLLSTNTPSITVTVAETMTPTPSPTPTLTPSPTITPSGGGPGQIAFVSDRTGASQIYLSNLDGTDLRPITNIPEGACQPSWAPDGKRLVFVSPCAWQSDMYSTVYYRNSTLFIINADGSGAGWRFRSGLVTGWKADRIYFGAGQVSRNLSRECQHS
jgi:serine/threonine protein kinase